MAEDDHSISGAGNGREADEPQATPGLRPWAGWRLIQQAALPLVGLAVGIAVVAAVVDGDGPGGIGGAPEPVAPSDSTEEVCSETLDRVRQIPHDAAHPMGGVSETADLVSDAAGRIESDERILAAALEAQVVALEELARAYEAGDSTGYRVSRARLREAGKSAQTAARAADAPDCARLARLLRRRFR